MDDSIDTTVQAAALRAARTRARMSQRHLAQAAGVSDRTVRRAEAGLPISDEVTRSLCAVLAIDARGLGATGPTPPASHHLRPMQPVELGIRCFTHSLFRWVGGVHPVLFLFWLLSLQGLRPDALHLFFLMQALVHVLMLCIASKGCDTWSLRLRFLQGRVFADGQPVELRERRRLRIAEVARERGAPQAP
jgi:transcriptional regulator with XRE-family HTH domain